MNADVIKFPASTNFNAEQALSSALQHDLTDVLIVGYYEDGSLFVRSSKMDRKTALWMIKKAELNALGIE